MTRRSVKIIVILAGLAVIPGSGLLSQEKDIFSEFRQIIPRGRIAAITEPKFDSADKANIDDDSWVLGVVIDGVAKAYSLSLLNSHEVVNDQVGDTKFAAVW